MVGSVIDLFIVPGILTAIGIAVVLIFAWKAVFAPALEEKHHWLHTADGWERAFRAMQDANDRVIVELESHPATYETFPEDVRKAVYDAHDTARSIGRGK